MKLNLNNIEYESVVQLQHTGRSYQKLHAQLISFDNQLTNFDQSDTKNQIILYLHQNISQFQLIETNLYKLEHQQTKLLKFMRMLIQNHNKQVKSIIE
ncbi:hypothetical protein SS50377_27042 [Spironucleus salmonicida]|uniref:Uncharacterized protein n=1 Tax=Spironucleus salmonicida TaxID=348837 RepID=V6LSB4_9EUKA|nr:hypothetical protein SS50377_27042 [Spironucleus salmonicida]|eukprot:EST47552.1 Hypothetical protein SS50377_12535 [Spironucleus salmonicida]